MVMDVCLQFLIAVHFVFACIFTYRLLPEQERRVGIGGCMRQYGCCTRAFVGDCVLLVVLLAASRCSPSGSIVGYTALAQSLGCCWMYCVSREFTRQVWHATWFVLTVFANAGAQVD